MKEQCNVHLNLFGYKLWYKFIDDFLVAQCLPPVLPYPSPDIHKSHVISFNPACLQCKSRVFVTDFSEAYLCFSFMFEIVASIFYSVTAVHL